MLALLTASVPGLYILWDNHITGIQKLRTCFGQSTQQVRHPFRRTILANHHDYPFNYSSETEPAGPE